MKKIILFLITIFCLFSVVKPQDLEKAIAYLKAKDYENAAVQFEGTLPYYKKNYGENDTANYSLILYLTARSYDYSMNYTKAEKYYSECIKIHENINGTLCNRYANCCNNLGFIYFNSEKYEEAERLYIKSNETFKNIFGKNNLKYLVSGDNLGVLYLKIGKYDEAEKIFFENKSIYEKLVGKKNIDYAENSNSIASLYLAKKEYTKAINIYQELKSIYEELLGKGDFKYATCCLNLANAYKNKTEYEKSETYYIEAIKIFNSLLGKNSLNYTSACNDLADLYRIQGNYKKAEKLYLEVKAIYNENKETEYEAYAFSCDNLGNLYLEQSFYKKAEKEYNEAKEITKKAYGKKHYLYAVSCNNIANLYTKTSEYSKALNLYAEAKKIIENIHGKESYEYASCCNNLAGLYETQGNYNEAEKLYLEAYQISKKTIGENHVDFAGDCNNLGSLYYNLGDYEKAEGLFVKAKNIYENNLGKENIRYASTCNNLACLYDKKTDYDKAEVLYIEAKEIRENLLGKDNLSYGETCNNLAVLYLTTKKYKQAEPLFLETMQINKKVLGGKHTSCAVLYSNLGYLYEVTERYSDAENVYKKAKEIFAEKLGKNHNKYAASCMNIAVLLQKQGDFKKSEPIYLEANKIIENEIIRSSKFMTENEREQYLKEEINFYYDAFNSFYLAVKDNKTNFGAAYNNALLTKGQLLRSSVAVRKAVLQSQDKNLLKTYNEMNSVGKILSEEYAKQIENRRSDIKELEEKQNTLEKELVRKSQNFAKVSNFGKVNWETVQKSLKEEETAIEFLHFNYRNNHGKKTDSTLYYALVLRKNYEYPKAVFLFEENQLVKIMQRPENTNEYHYIKNLYDKKSAKADSLYKLVWLPLEQYLNPEGFKNPQGTSKVYISPSGILNSISFDAIPYDTANILSDKYKIIYTTTTAEAINTTGLYQKNIKNSVLFGGLMYDIDTTEMQTIAAKTKNNYNPEGFEDPQDFAYLYANRGEKSPLGDLGADTRGTVWNYLPGSLDEAEEIKKILKQKNIETKLYKDKEGSEEQFKQIENIAPSILHISTHGFYYPEPEIKRKDYFNYNDIVFTASDNPLLRSGLLLTGAQNAFSGKKIPKGIEDGVLTASEISKMNLFNTKLAVLSACQTGLGKVKGNEGVYGLQRAFKMAGVEYLIYSLWEVPDKTTKELMTNFYENWFSGMEIRDAFKKAQDTLKKKYKNVSGSAFAWAAFVLMK